MEEQNNGPPIITVKTSVSRAAHREFYWQWMLRYRKGYYVQMALNLLLTIAVYGFAFWTVFADTSRRYTGFTLVLPFLMYAFYACLPGHYYSEHREIYLHKTVCTFYEAHLVARRKVNGILQANKLPYGRCGAFETKTAFCVCPPTAQAERHRRYDRNYYNPDPYGLCVILDKPTLAPDQIDALRSLFALKFGAKFTQSKQK